MQEFRRAGESEVLLIADKLVAQFCAATGFEPTGEPMQSFPGNKIEGIGAQHPFLDRTAIVLTADFVTMDTGTGAVHIAPGHGEDDYSLGKTNGLPILSPVDDHGRYTNEAGIPELAGKYVFDANRDIVGILREKGMLLGEADISALLSLLLALENADHFPRGRSVLHSHRRTAIGSARRHQEGEMDSGLGRESHRRNRGIAPRLGDLAPTQLGRAASSFLFAERRSDSRIRNGFANWPIWSRNADQTSGSSWMTLRSHAN